MPLHYLYMLFISLMVFSEVFSMSGLYPNGKLEWQRYLGQRYFASSFFISMIDCVEMCLKSASCQSFNYAPLKQHCQLNNETKINAAQHFKVEKDYIYSEIKEWNKDWIGQCASITCNSKQSCEVVAERPTCIISECDVLQIPQATLSSLERRNGSIVKVNCYPGYNPKHYFYARCEEQGTWNLDAACKGNVTTLDGALVVLGIYTEQEVASISENDQRNTLIVAMEKRSLHSISQLQSKPSYGDINSLMGMAAIYIFLRDMEIRTIHELSQSDYDTFRNTLIVDLETRLNKQYTVSQLQGMTDLYLVSIGFSSF